MLAVGSEGTESYPIVIASDSDSDEDKEKEAEKEEEEDEEDEDEEEFQVRYDISDDNVSLCDVFPCPCVFPLLM